MRTSKINNKSLLMGMHRIITICIQSLLLICFFVFATSVLTSCGGDDEATIEDGVHVTKGKKLVLVSVFNPKSHQARVFYDNRDRIIKIEQDDDLTIEVDYEKREFVVDYYSKVYYDGFIAEERDRIREESKMHYPFTTNSKGYISQIGSTSFIYDSDGFLQNIAKKSGLWDIMYQNDDIIMFTHSLLSSRNQSIYICNYDDNNQYKLFLEMPNSKLHGNGDWPLGIIAYYSGLFGRTSTHFRYLTESELGKFYLETTESKYNGMILLKFE